MGVAGNNLLSKWKVMTALVARKSCPKSIELSAATNLEPANTWFFTTNGRSHVGHP